jgi:anti-anti-sigma factor
MNGTLHDVRVERPRADAAVVVFTGEHDLMTASRVQTLLDSLVEQNHLVVADFSEAEFVDSSVLNTLFRAHSAAESRGSSFRLQLGTAMIVRRAFELSGILRHLSCAESRAEALDGAERLPVQAVDERGAA